MRAEKRAGGRGAGRGGRRTPAVAGNEHIEDGSRGERSEAVDVAGVSVEGRHRAGLEEAVACEARLRGGAPRWRGGRDPVVAASRDRAKQGPASRLEGALGGWAWHADANICWAGREGGRRHGARTSTRGVSDGAACLVAAGGAS